MDARIKSGHDERVLSSTPLSQDAESLEIVIASAAKIPWGVDSDQI
jgi:hypothetical protein